MEFQVFYHDIDFKKRNLSIFYISISDNTEIQKKI